MLKPNPGHWGDPLFLPDVLRAFGVKVKEFEHWRDRGQGDFGKIWGIMVHHTGSNNASPASIAYGHSALRGLLSQIHLGRDGVATIVGAGIAWHAGVGSYPGIQKNNANPVMVGVEANSDGTSPWPLEMLDAYYRICAAVCWYLGHSSLRTIGHKEWAAIQGKWDPGGIDMAQFRAKVQYYITNPPFMPKPEQQKELEENMAFWEEQVASMVNPKVSFTRKEYIRLIDLHATKADVQSEQNLAMTKQVMAELKLMREDIQMLADALSKKEG